MRTTANAVRTPQSARTADEILRGAVDALLGVSAEATQALATIEVKTVFDLAASRVFAAASNLLAISTGGAGRLENRLNAVPADAVDAPAGIAAAEFARQPISILRSIGASHAAAIAAALDSPTVRDLALWPPYRAAQEILAEAFFPEQQTGFDLEAPADLLPQFGVYPTEKVFYQRLLIDASPSDLTNIPAIENLSGAVDILPSLLRPTGFEKLATGALLKFSQSWYSEGMTLGQLLHSTSLAPGESTRLAVIDWSRRSRAATTEQVTETERLSNDQTHNRALSEVTAATASEVQSGSSSTAATSRTYDSGHGHGFEIGPLAVGGSGGRSSTTTDVMTATSSFGVRNVAANFAQDINDSTQQNATSARDRRASTVREVSQAEHETISTRVLTNYNHMHALSVQYYEVVQAFRSTTQLESVERCLFLPVKLLDFSERATIERWRAQLGRAARSSGAARMLAEFGTVRATSQLPLQVPVRPLSVIGGLPVGSVVTPLVNNSPANSTTNKGGGEDAPASARARVEQDTSPPADYETPPTRIGKVLAAGWNLAQLEKIGRLTGRLFLPKRTNTVYIPEEALLIGVSLRTGASTQFQLRRLDGSLINTEPSPAGGVSLAAPVAISELESIAAQNPAGRSLATALILQLNLFGTITTLDVPIDFHASDAPSELQECVHFDAGAGMRELIDHLQSNALYYTQAILRALDGSAVASLLSAYSFRGLPLAQLVDQRPVAVTSNFLVFKMNLPASGDAPAPELEDDLKAWKKFLTRAGLDRPVPRSEIIPLPSGGVFGEAVLGRSNAAEPIDLTRFWNWQDSPIPLTAPEIAAVTAESRSLPEAAKTGQLSAPVVNIQSPSALPDPTGMAAITAAIQNANMFRDMSGMAQTAALAQSAQEASAAGATSGLQQAGENLKTVMDQKTQRLRIAAKLAAALAGVPVAGGSNPTERGGAGNEATALDKKTAAGGAASGSSAEAETFRAQQGSQAQTLANKVAAEAAAPEAGASSGGAPPSSPTRTVSPTTAAPRSILVVLSLDYLFTETSVFGPTPVQIEATIQDQGGQRIWARGGAAALEFRGPLQTSDSSLFLNMFYQYDLEWPQPTRVKTNGFVRLKVPAGATRLDAIAWAFAKVHTFTAAAAPTGDDDLATLIRANGITLDSVLAKPTITARSGGGVDVTAKVLLVVMEQTPSPAK